MKRILLFVFGLMAFNTLIGQISYTTSFTGCTASPCDNWSITGGSSPSITSTAGTGYTPCNTASAKSNIYGSSTTTTLARTSSLGTSSGLPATIELSYKCINYSTGTATPAGACTFFLEWATSSGGTWTSITSFTNVSSTTCTMVSYPNSFTPTNGQPVFVRVRAVRSSGDFWAVIDDINISQSAAPCPNPSALVATSITESGANISWTQSGCTAAGEYWVQTSATPPIAGTGTSVACPPAFPISVSGLAAGTTYNVFVKQDCGANGVSAVSNVGTFATLVPGDNCSNAIDLGGLTSPYSGTTATASNDFTNTCASGNTDKDLVFFIDVPNGNQLTIEQTVNGFDSENVISYGAACPSTTTSLSSVQIACYDDPDTQINTWINTTGSSQKVWFVEDGYSSGNSGTFTLAWSLLAPPAPPDCPNGEAIVCTTPKTNTLSGLGNWALTGCTGTTAGAEKVYKFTSTTAGTYSLVVTAVTGQTVHYFYKEASGSCDATGWTCIGKFSATGSQNVTLAANTEYYVLMDAEGTASRTQTFRIDCPTSCPKPTVLTNTNITANSADLSWTNGGSETMWKVSYGVAPLSDPATGTIVDVSSKPYNLAMLAGQTTYDWYVRADCGGGDLSAWSNKNTFTTLIDCAAATDLSCAGSVTSGNLATTGGQWNLTTCYFGGTPGKEKIYRFTPSLTGTHTLNITGVNGGSGYIDYFYKLSSDGCSSTGWTCITDKNAISNTAIGTLTAGTEYYILLDAESAASTANHTFQIDCPANMVYTSSTTEQLSNGIDAAAGSSNNQIIKVSVVVTGTGNPISVTNLSLDTEGSAAATNDIAAAKVYYTGTTNTFSTTTQFGMTIANPNTGFDVAGTQVLTGGTAATTNYFWLVYDLKCGATPTNIVDAECNLITVGGVDEVPTVEAPVGSRPISALYAPSYASVGTSSVTQGSTLQQIVRMNISGSSICPQNAESVVFNTSTSTAPATDISSAKCYYTTTTTFSAATPFGSAIANPPAGDMTFTGTQALASGSGNYFWLVYDVDCAASTSNVLNGTGVNIVVAGNTYTTTGTTPTAKTIAAIASYDTKQDGPWNTGSTWACNSVPPSGTSSPVNLNHNVSFDAADFTYNGNLVIATGKNLTFTTNTLTIGPSGGGNKTVTVNGGLIMNGGVFNINGSLSFGASASFSMTNGDINIDGNGGSGNSISGAMFALGSTMSFSMSGGTITFVDPNFTSSTNLISYSGTPAISPNGGLLRFGDGNSSTGTTNGFYYAPGSGGKLQWYNVDINGGSGTRQVYCNWELIVKNKLDVKTGCVLELNDDLHILKDLNNDGTIRFASTSYYLCFGGYSAGVGTTVTPTSSVQAITGNGIYNNTVSSPTANLPNLHVNNTSGTPIILPTNFFTGVGTGSVGLILYLTSGILDIGGGTFILGTSGTSAGTLNGGSASSYIIGIMKRWQANTTGTRLFPIGTASNYYGATINFTGAPTTAGSLTAQFISGDAGSAGLPLVDGTGSKPYANTLCTTGYWQIDAGNSLAGGTYTANMIATGFSCVDDFTTTRLLKRADAVSNWALAGTFGTGTGSNAVPTVNRTANTGFSQFAVSQGQLNPLPVELTSFTGQTRDKANQLKWSAESELNFDRYILERAPEVREELFTPITEVEGKGSVTQAASYEYMDEQPLPLSYYRLKMMDTDGTYKFSKIIVLENAKVGLGDVKAFPVPSSDLVTVTFNATDANEYRLILTDINGRVINNEIYEGISGFNQTNVNLGNYPSGVYYLSIIGGQVNKNIQLVKE